MKIEKMNETLESLGVRKKEPTAQEIIDSLDDLYYIRKEKIKKNDRK